MRDIMRDSDAPRTMCYVRYVVLVTVRDVTPRYMFCILFSATFSRPRCMQSINLLNNCGQSPWWHNCYLTNTSHQRKILYIAFLQPDDRNITRQQLYCVIFIFHYFVHLSNLNSLLYTFSTHFSIFVGKERFSWRRCRSGQSEWPFFAW